MIRLGVNIDHVATIRQARKTYEPDPLWAAAEAQLGGADGITVHLREDRRHIQDHDLERLAVSCQLKLNLEMAATKEMLAIAIKHQPHMAMFVPEGRHEVTTEGGLNILANEKALKKATGQLLEKGIPVSVFIDPEPEQVAAAKRIGASVCEIHTGPYAHAFFDHGRSVDDLTVAHEIQKIAQAGAMIVDLGMSFNAGHALNYNNVHAIAAIPNVAELHIGHAIVSRAVFVGMREAVREMKRLMVHAASAIGA